MERDDSTRTRTFHEQVWPHRRTVLRVASLLAGHESDAEDLAQETLLRAFRGIESFRPGTDVVAWLMAILRNARIDRLRSRQQHEAARTLSLDALEHDPPDPAASPEEADAWQSPERVMDAFSDQQVIEALHTLPEAMRFTLLLADVEQIDHAEVARILDVPAGTVKSRVHRGRAMLRRALLPLARDLRLVKGNTGSST